MKLRKIESGLEKHFGRKIRKSRGSAVDVLISTILSQSTSDINSGRAFGSLKASFKSWEAVGRASLGRIEKSIRAGGLARIKAGYIKKALGRIRRDYGKYDLSGLKKMGIEESLKYLTSFPGVGEKTAACVLLFAFGRKVMPVDTHVHRVSVRLGLVPEGSDRGKTFQFWFGQNNIVDYYNLHLNMVQHGRVVCLARKPRCGECVLRSSCLYFKNRK